jgi:hypothetical protein
MKKVCLYVERKQFSSIDICPVVDAAKKLNNNIPNVCNTCSAFVRSKECH